MSNYDIGIYDSGIGGLTIARSLSNAYPSISILYYADISHLPYGEKSPHEIKSYRRYALDFFRKYDCNNLLIACNTASVNFLPEERLQFPEMNILDVVEPFRQNVLDLKNKHSVAILCTEATKESGYYQKNLSEHYTDIEVITPAELVRLIERFPNNSPEIRKYLNDQVRTRISPESQIIMLACTHFPIVRNQIKDILNSGVLLLDAIEVSRLHVTEEFGLQEEKEQGSLEIFFNGQYEESYISHIKKTFPELDFSVIAEESPVH